MLGAVGSLQVDIVASCWLALSEGLLGFAVQSVVVDGYIAELERLEMLFFYQERPMHSRAGRWP